VNVDFEDVRTVMSEQGKAMMGTAKASGPERARIAAEQAVACPLLEGIDMSGAKGVLVLVTAAKGGLKLSESREAMSTICKFASNDAHVIYGTAYDEELGDEIRVTVVATGLSSPGKSQAQPFKVIRTGTDNVPLQVNASYHNPVSNQPPALLPTRFDAPATNLPSVPVNPFVEDSTPVSMASVLSTPSAPEQRANPRSSQAQPNYTDMAVPSVWRTNRVQAAAKVDALASGGMDDYEIPAFLRKQAD